MKQVGLIGEPSRSRVWALDFEMENRKKKIPSGEIYFLEMSKQNGTVVLVCFRERSTVGT